MAENTTIQWTDFSWNPWIGCSKVHTGCEHCFAEQYGKRFGVQWGPNGTRRKTSDGNWRKPLAWNRKAAEGKLTHRPRVFLSLCDPFEDWPHLLRHHKGPQLTIRNGQYLPGATGKGFRLATLDDLRRDLFRLIDATPNLDWILLTKRPENIRRMLPAKAGWAVCANGIDCTHPDCEPSYYRSNLWLLYSASDQETLDAGMPHLLGCCDLVPVLGVSLEPLLERVDFSKLRGDDWHGFPALDWGIIGGESGREARPCNVEHVRDAVEQFRAADVPCFVKGLGVNPVIRDSTVDEYRSGIHAEMKWPEGTRFRGTRVFLKDPKGGNPEEWPADLRVRQWPEAR